MNQNPSSTLPKISFEIREGLDVVDNSARLEYSIQATIHTRNPFSSISHFNPVVTATLENYDEIPKENVAKEMNKSLNSDGVQMALEIYMTAYERAIKDMCSNNCQVVLE